MAGRVILGGIVGGLVMFFWGAVAHMMTPLGHMGLSMLPAEREGTLLAAMKQAVPADGLYYYPGTDMSRSMTPEEEKSWNEKLRTGPSGLMMVHLANGTSISPKLLLTELATNIGAALLAAVLLTATRLGFLGRAGFVVLLGQIGWISITLSYWNWYGFPTAYVLAESLTEGIGWLLVGLTLAAIVRPGQPAASA